MLEKKVIKDIQSLSVKKSRQEQGLFVAEGPKLVGELLMHVPHQVLQLYALPEWAEAHRHLDVQVINVNTLSRISQLQTPNMVVAVCRQAAPEEPRLQEGWCLYLDALQDPGNLGTIIRTADWFGVSHVVCSATCADLYNPKVVQATMGSIARVNVWYDEESSWLQRQSLPLYAAALNGRSVYDLQAGAGGVVLIGNESKGIRAEVLLMAEKITIPRRGVTESLNAAVAAGIILAQVTK